ncbi:MAG: hypothetical protein AB1810_02360 [Pseudomonadota bacterium]
MVDIEKRYPEGLRAVLYFLHYMPDVYNEEKYEALSELLKKNYSSGEIERYRSAVEWALSNLDANFKEIDPGLHQSDVEIIFFLKRFKFLCEEKLA